MTTFVSDNENLLICHALVDASNCVSGAVGELHTAYYGADHFSADRVRLYVSRAREQLAKALASVDAAIAAQTAAALDASAA